MTATTITKDQYAAARYRRLTNARDGSARGWRNQILLGDALTTLRTLPDDYVDCIVTSPPYHLLRRYHAGAAEIGTETNVEGYVEHLVEICDELARVLTPHGGLWLNIGDSFSRGESYGAPSKALLLAPERLLMSLASRGWRLRNKIVWAKSNPMPHSASDRFSTTWEPMFFLVRSEHYYFDLDVIREPHLTTRTPGPPRGEAKYGGKRPPWVGPLAGTNDGLARIRAVGLAGHPLGKNPGDVWRIATARFRGDHFAVFPEELGRRPLLAGCPERVCMSCGRPWQRQKRRDQLGGLSPSCLCEAPWRRGRAIDPFMGSGTVAVAAERLGRDWLGIELNPAFVAIAELRLKESRVGRVIQDQDMAA